MLRKTALAISATAFMLTAAPAFAQDEVEEARTTYRIEFLKFKPGAAERWNEMGEKYWGPATDKAGMPQPTIHWMMAGPWDIMMVMEMPRGLEMLDSHNPPERTTFMKAFTEVAGGEEAAKKLMDEDGGLIANSMVTYSHTHP